MFDFDIAELYGVPTKALNQGVKRNLGRFPEDFMFQLSKEELDDWRSHFVTSKSQTKMRLRRPPFAFTEHGVTMLASVLSSDQAVQMSIRIVRTFVQMREIAAEQLDLAARMRCVEREQENHASIIGYLAEEVEELKLPPEAPKRAIRFQA